MIKFREAIPFDHTQLDNVCINLRQLEIIVNDLINRHQVTGLNKIIWSLKALTLIDLTTLSGDDTKSNIKRLCQRAVYPLKPYILEKFPDDVAKEIHNAAICVYPARVKDAHTELKNLCRLDTIKIAAVATGFPSGQYSLKSRINEIEYAISEGANEIDIVINRSLAINEKWEELYEEIYQMRLACGQKAKMKTILAIGELGTMENVYKASMVAMMAGTDFIKTSTGKETVNATLTAGLVMIRAIQAFYSITGENIGLKPAGGLKTVNDAINWMILVKETLGVNWLKSSLFRFGASGLLDDIENFLDQEC